MIKTIQHIIILCFFFIPFSVGAACAKKGDCYELFNGDPSLYALSWNSQLDSFLKRGSNQGKFRVDAWYTGAGSGYYWSAESIFCLGTGALRTCGRSL